MKKHVIILMVTLSILSITTADLFAIAGDMGYSTDPCSNGTEAHPYLIEDFNDFQVFSTDPNFWATGVHTQLNCDLDLNPNLPNRQIYTTAPIAPELSYFKGIFDGSNHIISNLTIDGRDESNYYLGLFGQIQDPNAEVKNLGIEDSNAIGGAASYYVGGLCGYNHDGTISNCYNIGEVEGRNYLGGLCGYNYDTIINCYAICNVTGRNYLGGLCGNNNQGIISNCYAQGAVIGEDRSDYLGGLCGYNYDGIIINCYANCEVTGDDYLGGLCGSSNLYSTIAHCYAIGSVFGDDNISGFCGYNANDSISCFWDVNSSGIGVEDSNDCGAIGKTTAQMQTLDTFIDCNWDFVGEQINDSNDIWRMCVDGVEYPKLWWQFAPADFACNDGVDMVDFAILADTWNIAIGEDSYNEKCDLAKDDIIDFADLAIFTNYWLEGVE